MLEGKVVIVGLWFEGREKEKFVSVCEWRGRREPTVINR
jgi:hypothetical protein